MWIVFAIITIAIILYAIEVVSVEITSLFIISSLLLLFHLIPSDSGSSILKIENLLRGFSNPALITVMCLLVIGQSLVQTGALNKVGSMIISLTKGHKFLAILLSFLIIFTLSAFLNNTPIVVIFIPIMAAIAKELDINPSKVMMPLSFAAILGGMITLIGSSTNLLVSGAIESLGFEPLKLFDFAIPGLIMAGVGFIYIMLIAPYLLPNRRNFDEDDSDSRKFISQIEIKYFSKLVNQNIKDNLLPLFDEIDILMIKRGKTIMIPPFSKEEVVKVGDMVILSTNKQKLSSIYSDHPELLDMNFIVHEDHTDDIKKIHKDKNHIAEAIIAPASRMVGQSLRQAGIYNNYNCLVIGIQRQSRIIRNSINDIRLMAGDTLLVLGSDEDLIDLRSSKDVVITDLEVKKSNFSKNAVTSSLIFIGVTTSAALGIVPIVISSFIGASTLILIKSINIRQAMRAMDRKIFFMVGASLALSYALQATGGAAFIATNFIEILGDSSKWVILMVLFFTMALFTNILSNNASAVLFTPIAINMAINLGADPKIFIIAVIFACNCSFITPIGYQTNLLVMGPGNYRFADFVKVGLPLTILMCLTYTLFAPWYFQ